MRLKTEPGDFLVNEDLTFDRVPDGDYYVHVLRKEKLDTHQALAKVAKLAGVGREDLAFAGLKDRQGKTEQWISIRGRRVDHKSRELSVHFRGRTDQPINSQMSRGNSFRIVVRDLSLRDVEDLTAAADRIRVEALPNYFDDQRFGCLRHGQGFVMRSILRGDYEDALQRMIARPSPAAIAGDVKLKKILAQKWGDWDACASVARGPVYRRTFQHLQEHPYGFSKAIALQPTRIKLIHAFAYQSFLWNRAVDRMLYRILAPAARVSVETLAGRLLAWHRPFREVAEHLRSIRAPLFGPEGNGGDPEFAAAMEEVLHEMGHEPEDFRTHRVPGMILREEPRQLGVRPRDLEVSERERDEIHRGRFKITLSFGLPRGSYATMVVKRLMAGEPRRRPPQRGRRD